MNFEEALTAMRKGSKIRHPSFEEDIYFQACRTSLIGAEPPDKNSPLSIVKMKGEFAHEDMKMRNIDEMCYPGTFVITDIKAKYFHPNCKHGPCPQLNLFLVMDDDWEVIN